MISLLSEWPQTFFILQRGFGQNRKAGTSRIGLSDYLQQRSGDIAFVEIMPVGTELAFGDEVAVIETIKVNISLGSPVSGKVAEVNPDMEMAPEVINQDPYGKGWIAIVEASNWEIGSNAPVGCSGIFRQN